MKKFTKTSTLSAAFSAALLSLAAFDASAQLVTITSGGAPATSPRVARAFDQMKSAIVERIQEEEPQGSQIFMRSFDLVTAQVPALGVCRERTMATGVATVSYRSQANAALRQVSFDVCVPESSQFSALMVQAKPDTFQTIEQPDTARFVSLPALNLTQVNSNCDYRARHTVDSCVSDSSFEIIGVGEPAVSGSSQSRLLSVAPSARPNCVSVTFDIGSEGSYDRGLGIRDCRGRPSINITIPVVAITKVR